jgi:hypothetical protein
MNSLFELLGSPFLDKPLRRFSDQELLDIYDIAFPNRVALLYLSLHRREGWDLKLEDKYQKLKAREETTRNVICKLGEVLNRWNTSQYAVFKSIRPYAATPNDTDVICLGDEEAYEDMYRHVLDAGYIFHEWAPQQRTVYDPRGAGKIGSGKKGGIYYIDLYSEISTDYFSYLNKNRLGAFVVRREIDAIPVNLLRPEPELAIMMFHSVFPERTFQLEHFYAPLYMLANPEFDLELFIEFSREAGLAYAVKSQASIIAWMHERRFNFVPAPILRIIERLGCNRREVSRFRARKEQTPYMFSPRTFWTAFLFKAMEWHCFKSLLVQGIKMLNPKFFLEVVRSIRLRMSETGTYHLE